MPAHSAGREATPMDISDAYVIAGASLGGSTCSYAGSAQLVVAKDADRRRLGRPVLSRREAFPANGCTPAPDARPPERRDHVVGG